MQSPASGTRTWRRGHQISTDPAQEKEITSVDERKAGATARRWSCGADLLSKTDTVTAFKKQLWVWVRHKSAGIIRLPLRHHCDVATAAALRRIHECSHAPLSRVFEKASAHVHATCTVFVLPHIVLARPVDKTRSRKWLCRG